jgi:hypothetical protein
VGDGNVNSLIAAQGATKPGLVMGGRSLIPVAQGPGIEQLASDLHRLQNCAGATCLLHSAP